jgi:osmotically-inducible protein OsmY
MNSRRNGESVFPAGFEQPENAPMKKFLLFLSGAVAVLILLSGCAMLQGQDLADAPDSDAGAAALANNRLNGDAMTARATLNVQVEDGLAILYGTVPDEATRQRALQILEGTPGVYEVLDRTRRR